MTVPEVLDRANRGRREQLAYTTAAQPSAVVRARGLAGRDRTDERA